MKSPVWRWVILTIMVVAVAVAAIVKYRAHRAVRPVSTREEVVVAETLLAEKLSGPRYFNAAISGIRDEGGPWINVTDALSQVSRVAGERMLGPEGIREIRRLIEKLTEPHPSRMVGGERINLLRLNLSLDSVH